MIKTAAIALFLFAQIAGAGVTEAATLEDCFAAALKQSEAVAVQREQLFQAREHAKQASGSLLPSVSGVASYAREDSSHSTNALKKSVSPATQPLVKLTAIQPLFRGTREYAALRQAGKLADAQSAALQQSEISLYRDVVMGFYSVLTAEHDLSSLSDQLSAYDARIRELQARESVGKSRSSEILAAQAARANLSAQAEQMKGQIAVARETLSFMTGLDRTIELKDSESSATLLEPLETYLQGADRRPDVTAAGFKMEAAHAGLWMAKGALLPSVDLMGNYYLKRTGISEGVKWDAQLALTVPLFAGGANLSRIREASSVDRQSALEKRRVRRLAEQDIRTVYNRAVSDSAQAGALTTATALAERSYQEQTKDYRLGLVTNVDVLQALASALESRRALNRATFTLRSDLIVLDAASGRRNP